VKAEQTFARILAVVVAFIVIVNALFMLASPRAWFRLPSWIRAQGVLTEHKYGSGWRGALVRVLGALILIIVGGIIYDIVSETLLK
jgi:uncharacterized membrane protein YphA (DoxX/SURF4 family)